MKRKSVAVINIPFIMRKLDLSSEDETDDENKEKEVPEEEDVENSDTDSDSGIVPDAPEEASAKEKMRSQKRNHVQVVAKYILPILGLRH